ncbi:MAG: AtpZ/AtpI family protein [Gemmatimonadales bacterium]|nr:AtpZ/AtpI family protein [Gemmatimonadales bacterium]
MKSRGPPEQSTNQGDSGAATRYAGFGVQLAASLLIFVWLGQWADKRFGTGGLFTIVAAFLAFGGSMYSLVRSLNRKDDVGKDQSDG